ncbi:replication initiation protein [Pseudonocardia sp. ICBG601]|uniref:replication initiation protein n=1 Tax=Pseudonocardia sp. ICBG601 TaxID=2846759 RepID=UPI001CF6DC2E|nr:replication initiation protein [Pseudonocardia sp. ICBG601]
MTGSDLWVPPGAVPDTDPRGSESPCEAPIEGPGYLVGGLPFEAATAIWGRLWTSRYPLAADEFDDGVWRQTREEAMTRMHVELHPKQVWGLIGIDGDSADAVLRMVSTVDSHPMPNVIIENPVNGHAHAGFGITTPINVTNYGSRRAVRYGLSIEEALRRAVGGDPSYPGRLIKNPFHSRWITHFLHDKTSTLNQFGAILTAAGHMPGRGWHNQRRRAPVGYSRNETLFHMVRRFAYREMRHHWGDADGYRAAVAKHVAILNADFPIPLGGNELGHISGSISDWTINYSRMWNDGPAAYDAAFSAIQAARGRKGSGRNGGLIAGRIRGDDQIETSRQLREALAKRAFS